MARKDSRASPVPADFPRACGGSISGAQPKIVARLVAGKFVEAPTEEECRARYVACAELVEQLVEYSRRKRAQAENQSLREFMRRVRAAVIRKEWGLEAGELDWVMHRVTILMGGTAADAPHSGVLDVVDLGMPMTTTPVESIVDKALATLRDTPR